MDRQCQARQDRTGAFTCVRCGYQWDMDDDKPECKTERDLLHETVDRCCVEVYDEPIKYKKVMLDGAILERTRQDYTIGFSFHGGERHMVTIHKDSTPGQVITLIRLLADNIERDHTHDKK